MSHSTLRRARNLVFRLVIIALPVSIHAQQPASSDTMYLRAHQMVSSGQGEAGRLLVDSLLRATLPGTPAYAEGLYWRAVTAGRSEDAERDYLTDGTSIHSRRVPRMH